MLLAAVAWLPVTARKTGNFSTKLAKDEQIQHALARLTFGERPGDAEVVGRLGVKKWIDRQLHPDRFPEDPALRQRLQSLPTLTLSPAELISRYPPPQVRAQARKNNKPADDPAGQQEGRQAVRTVARELVDGKLYRAIYSDQQLAEVLTDFWFNHFNVFFDKGFDRFLTTSYEREAIRPNVLGKFEDLLIATAQSPAMLFYLDNWQSITPVAPRARKPNARARGINENYARELLELHTLGVEGGYTQQDVMEVARCFTGWTIAEPLKAPRFEFNARLHDSGEKVVLGEKIAAGGGMDDGLKVLRIVAKHPSTAKFISWKLAQRFVADQPPPELVARMTATFQKSGGNILDVLKTMLDSKEFWTKEAYHAKVKSPLEFVVSAVRSTGAEVSSATALAVQIGQLGQPLYRKQEPTGYPNTGEEWLSSASLLGRLNFATSLSQNRVAGVRLNAPDPQQIAQRIGGPDFQKR